MTRFVSFRFDDGHLAGAHKAADMLGDEPASFFVITGRVQTEPDRAHGRGRLASTLEDWRALSRAGHDVQSHSVTHPSFPSISSDQQAAELRGSIGVLRQIHAGPYLFCFPFNQITEVDLRAEGYLGGGFVTLSSDSGPIWQGIDEPLDPFRLRSWAVRERHFDRVVRQLSEGVPDSTWTILAFHSFDGEGHEPWTSEGFARLVAAVRAEGYQTVSVAGMLERLGRECRLMGAGRISPPSRT